MTPEEYFKKWTENCRLFERYQPIHSHEDMMQFAKDYHAEQLRIGGVVKSLPTRDEAKIEMKDYVSNYYEDSETKEMLEFAIGFMHCLNWITEKNKK